MATPIKFIRSSIGGVSVKSTATIGGVAGVPYQWNATLTVVAQAHSDPTSTPVANYYTGRNVVVGDWITSDPSGKALKVASITSQTDTQVVCVLQDVDYANALSDETGNLDGMIPNGAGIGAYIFSVKNSVPLLGNIPASLPGNLAGSDFVNNIQSRFAASATVGIDSTTGKLDASILPAPVVGGTPGAVGVTSSGPFALDASGNLTLKAGTASMVGGVKVPSSGAELAIDASGNISLAASGATAGTYGNLTVDAKGRVTAIAALTAANIPTLDWAKIGTGKPTTLAGFGITDALSTSMKGAANGIASLDASGLVPASQLPSYVDDVVEYAALANLPTTGESGKIYVTTGDGKIFRWSGTTYIEISATAGTADAATKLATARTIGMTGDVTWTSAGFDGSANVTGTATLANSGVTAGTYKSVTVDAKGRVTGGTNPTTLAGYGITDAATLASPALTGTPTAPTAAAGTNTTQIATTAFTTAAVGNVVSTAPTALNTLAKIATSINNDPNVCTTLTGLMDSKIATAIANLVGGASASANTLSELEALLTVEVNQRQAADAVMQATLDVLQAGGVDVDGGSFVGVDVPLTVISA